MKQFLCFYAGENANTPLRCQLMIGWKPAWNCQLPADSAGSISCVISNIVEHSDIAKAIYQLSSLNGNAEFYGRSPKELRAEFRKSLKVFLEVCEEKGIDPHRHFSGKFNLRIAPELHERLAIRAQAQGVSINALVQEYLQKGASAS